MKSSFKRIMNRALLWVGMAVLAIPYGQAAENTGTPKKKRTATPAIESGCPHPTAQVFLDVNNVRAAIMNGGDMWWDLVGNPLYEIPKGSGKHSLFAGALWFGGLDEGGNLHVAAMTYRQSGVDFWPGPLDTVTVSTDATVCAAYDKIWKIDAGEVDNFINTGTPSATISDWPAHPIFSDKNHSYYLAPFVDVDGDGTYNPSAGDYPDILGDQALWFVYNDKGNIHTETEGEPVGVEIRAMAFAFATTGDINNMTFYKYTIINRATSVLEKAYLGQWVDPDLGNFQDDYVGCDTTRGLGICYNGDDNDEVYGPNPPAVGVDFFEGPLADPNDGIDNDKDGVVDEPGEKIIMSKFVYYNNDFTDQGNPEEAQHFYNYLQGLWKNGDCIKYGGDGFNVTGPCTKYMFPSDPRDPSGWSEVTAGNTPGDRRFLQSAGPFTLQPGAVNETVVGVVWARASSGGNMGSWDLLLAADDKAQRLYDAEFKLVEGPRTPDVVITELDRELVLTLVNTKETEAYDVTGLNEDGDSVRYIFEGYQIFQLRDDEVTTADLEDPDKARLVAVVDVKNGITKLVNREFDPSIGADVPKLMVEGPDEGIRHTFRIQKDLFTPGKSLLVNHWPYYFTVVAYAVSEKTTERRRYLRGRKNVKIYMGMPHKSYPEKYGLQTNAGYGDQPSITRISGMGNQGYPLALTPEAIAEALQNGVAKNLSYERGGGPLSVYVFDPVRVPAGTFEFRLVDSNLNTNSYYKEPGSGARGELVNLATNETVPFDTVYATEHEQVFEKWGLAFFLNRVEPPKAGSEDGGVVESSMEFEDPENPWLTKIPDVDFDPGAAGAPPYPMNWIRSGKVNYSGGYPGINDAYAGAVPLDPNQVYEKLADGIIAPYAVVARDAEHQGARTLGPVYGRLSHAATKLEWLPSIELVLTSDKSKWTKCAVIEMGEDPALTEGGAKKFQLRKHPSWSDPNAIDGDGNPIYDNSSEGYSWFPGYAINLETGERMNIIFGEDSRFASENGGDLIWNPTSFLMSDGGNYYDDIKYPWGGRHVVYIMNNRGYQGARYPYDGGQQYGSVLTQDPSTARVQYQKLWLSAAYVMMPLLREGFELKSLKDGLIPNEVRIRVVVRQPFQTFKPDDNGDGAIVYRFSTDDLAAAVTDSGRKAALELVNIVPNPYYGYSRYERNFLDSRVRITNLPPKVKISIYSLNGTLIRTIERDAGDDAPTYIDWDLTNENGTPIVSGLYLIHVDAGSLGQKTLKWVGIMRPTEIRNF